ncbi:hypothetical protein GGH17_004804, partial [Coemansia sp. RSA 788]
SLCQSWWCSWRSIRCWSRRRKRQRRRIRRRRRKRRRRMMSVVKRLNQLMRLMLSQLMRLMLSQLVRPLQRLLSHLLIQPPTLRQPKQMKPMLWTLTIPTPNGSAQN